MSLSLSLGVGLGLSLRPTGMHQKGMLVFSRRYSSAAPSAVLPAAGKTGEG
jgi:hypothetical protein